MNLAYFDPKERNSKGALMAMSREVINQPRVYAYATEKDCIDDCAEWENKRDVYVIEAINALKDYIGSEFLRVFCFQKCNKVFRYEDE